MAVDIGQVGYEQIGGVSVRLLRGGVEEGIPILLLSPWPESIYGFRGVTPALITEGPVIAVDLPGFGRSEGAAQWMSPFGMADFLLQLVRQLNLRRVHAVAPDIGTLATLAAAATTPSVFASLTLGSGGTSLPLVGDGLRQLIESQEGAFADMDGGELALGFIRQAARGNIPPEVMEDYRLSSAGRRFEDAANFVRAYRTDLPRLEPLLKNIDVPALVISSDADAMVPPANGEFLTARMPRCRHVVLEGGHLIWEDAATEYGQLVREWITGGYRNA